MNSIVEHNYFFRLFADLFFGGVMIIFCVSDIQALDPAKATTQYIHDVWTTRAGLPQDSVNAIAQDKNGYLWLGTQEGLVRFDGVDFSVFDSRNIEPIKENFINTIFVDRQGSLWIAAAKRLLRRRMDGTFDDKGLLLNESVWGFSEDAAGNLWVSCHAEKDGIDGIAKFKDEQAEFYPIKGDSKSNPIWQTFPDKAGNLWIASSNGLKLFKNGEFKNYTTVDGLSDNNARTVMSDRDGNLWIGTLNGLNVFRDGKFTRFTTKDGLSNNSIRTVFEDSSGILWIGTDSGLNRMIDGKIQAVKNIEGLGDDYISAIFEDAEASLWIGTHANGLHRLRDGKFTVFGSSEGLLGNNVRAIYEDRDERILIGTSPGGLNILSGGKFKTYSTADGLASEGIGFITQDLTGVIWISTDNALTHLENEKLSKYAVKNNLPDRLNINSIYEAPDKSFWFGTITGLKRMVDGKIVSFADFDKFQNKLIPVIYEDRQQRMWVGTNEDTGYFKDGDFTSYPAEALKNASVWAIREDDEGVLWFGTWGDGLMRLKNDKLTVYAIKNGLFDDVQWTILDDGAGNLWMSSNRGIFRVSKKDLDDFAEGRISEFNSIVYGVEDGMRKRENNGGGSTAIRSRDGKLWFATTAGVVMIDPKNIKINQIAPPVVLEQVLVDEKPIAPNENESKILPAAKNLEFRYAGLSFIQPAKMKFKYKLEGFDADWIDAGTRRAAFYTNLPSGDYEFKVVAANSDGIWNEKGASFKFHASAPFWRTIWFYALVLLAITGITVLFYRWRVFNLKQKNLAQQRFSHQLIESQEAERKRIAAELHDGLGQSLIVILNRAMLGIKKGGDQERVKQELNNISESALQAIDEVTEITNNLRPQLLDRLGLTKAINAMITKLADVIEIESEVYSIDGIFNEMQEISIYRILQESLNNIIKHSMASNATVKIKLVENNVLITIEDNGQGFDVEHTKSKRSGLGLVGLKERTQLLNGEFSIESKVSVGTKIIVRIPI